jgi:uncharacterized protein with PQ loop repeat
MTFIQILDKVALVAAIVLPFFNIPLVLRIIQRKSSQDISLCWLLGVWTCMLLMAPSALRSPDVVWRTFNYFNILLFTSVVVVTLRYRKGGKVT